MSESDQWCTPPLIADPLEEFFQGPVDVDPCSNERSIVRARQAYFRGGLVLPWCLPDNRPGRLRTVYENFPYSRGEAWTAKAIAEMACGNVAELVRLSPMSTSTQWWADACLKPERNPRILALKKFAFIVPGSTDLGDNTCRFDPVLMYFGPSAERFTKAFASLTRWTAWGR